MIKLLNEFRIKDKFGIPIGFFRFKNDRDRALRKMKGSGFPE